MAYSKVILQKSSSLHMHLTANFYPPIPEWVKNKFTTNFEKYWNRTISLDTLTNNLSDVYTGGWGKYSFENFINDEDLYSEDY